MNSGDESFEPAKTKDSGLIVTLTKAKVNQEDLEKSRAEVNITDAKEAAAKAPAVEKLIVQASLKPFISLVWLGVITMALGFFVAMSRRSQDAKKLIPDARPAPVISVQTKKSVALEDVKEAKITEVDREKVES